MENRRDKLNQDGQIPPGSETKRGSGNENRDPWQKRAPESFNGPDEGWLDSSVAQAHRP